MLTSRLFCLSKYDLVKNYSKILFVNEIHFAQTIQGYTEKKKIFNIGDEKYFEEIALKSQ